MKASYIAIGVLGLAFGGLWFISGGTKPPQVQAAEQPLKVAAPLTHENLTFYLVRGPETAPNPKLFTLQEGLECGWAIVHETGNVNELLVENLSPDHELFVQSQDMIKGGKQDRLIASDMLLAPGSGRVPVRVHCVEQSRWTGRENDRADRFAVSSDVAVGKDIKIAKARGNQGQVWSEVQACQTKLSQNLKVNVADPQYRSSLQKTLENPEVRAKVAEYEAALNAAGTERGVIGVVFAVNG